MKNANQMSKRAAPLTGPKGGGHFTSCVSQDWKWRSESVISERAQRGTVEWTLAAPRRRDGGVMGALGGEMGHSLGDGGWGVRRLSCVSRRFPEGRLARPATTGWPTVGQGAHPPF